MVAPAFFGDNLTAFTLDTTLAEIVAAALVVLISFGLILPLFQLSKQSVGFYGVLFLTVNVGLAILVGLYSRGWCRHEVTTRTIYKPFDYRQIQAKIGIHFGLTGFNVTLEGTPHEQLNETINYNEQFNWAEYWLQGRNGFGPYSGQLNREYRHHLYTGTPSPILNVAEYLTLDGEKIRWGRFFRLAGYYTYIVLWCALILWVLGLLVLAGGNLTVAANFHLATGVSMLISCLIYWTVRYDHLPNKLVIPFPDAAIEPALGWSFYYVLGVGATCTFFALCWRWMVDVDADAIEQTPADTNEAELTRAMSKLTRSTSIRELVKPLPPQGQERARRQLTQHPPIAFSKSMLVLRVIQMGLAGAILAILGTQFTLSEDFKSEYNSQAKFLTFVPAATLASGAAFIALMFMPRAQSALVSGPCCPSVVPVFSWYLVVLGETCMSLLQLAAGLLVIGACKSADLGVRTTGVCERNNMNDLVAAAVVSAFFLTTFVLYLISTNRLWTLSTRRPSQRIKLYMTGGDGATITQMNMGKMMNMNDGDLEQRTMPHMTGPGASSFKTKLISSTFAAVELSNINVQSTSAAARTDLQAPLMSTSAGMRSSASTSPATSPPMPYSAPLLSPQTSEEKTAMQEIMAPTS